jgi:hypothetical protein
MMDGFCSVISVTDLNRIHTEKEDDDDDKDNVNNVKIISGKCAKICSPSFAVSKIMLKHYI